MQAAPQLKDLVLVGGGHAHVHVLKSFGMEPMPGVRLSLIGRDIETPYSGMIPGFVAGAYSFDECHIDLARLAAWTGARLIHAEATGIDRAGRRVLLRDRPPVSYDLLSLDIGAAPSLELIPGASQNATAVKPIAELGRRWLAFLDRVKDWRGPLRIAVVGGGAGGVELALAIDHRLRKAATSAHAKVTLATRDEILAGMAASARRTMRTILQRRGLGLIENAATNGIEPGRLHLDNGGNLEFDAAFVVTEASAPQWLAATGLALDAREFLAVDASLRTNDPQIFAAGDCATVTAHPRPKAGVFAVRQGPPLAANLRRALLGRKLEPFAPQSRYLSIIGTGDRRAVATRADWSVEGEWVWHWKDYIDRKWMRMYCEPPRRAMQMATPAAPDPALADAEARRLLTDIGMRCGGCGAKVGATVLARVLARLGASSATGVTIGLDAPDDAAMIEVPAGRALVQSVDFFRAFIDDPFVFGEVAAIHALGDIWAMGAKPHSALALAVVPAAAERLMEEDLFQMLSGARSVLDRAGCALIGGHSGEGPEAALGFSVNGLVEPSRALRKGGLKTGDKLVLTKPLGTGVIFAAAMRGAARGRWISAALASMRRPSSPPALAHACTDVTGFGLAGHLAEMIRASGDVSVDLRLDALPALDGAVELFAQGFASSLQPENSRARHLIDGMDRAAGHPKLPLLFDPQTAGGLLIAIPADATNAMEGVIIGEVRTRTDAEAFIRLE
jgi:selenide, water dikinase